MAWYAVGVAAVGTVMSNVSANKARGDARSAQASEMAFAQEQYDDWKEVYGPIQTNLADYYSSITPEYYSVLGIEDINTEFEKANTKILENLAQRNIDPSSGISASLMAQQELAKAEAKAEIRTNAPRMAAEDKTRFLQIGLGQNPASNLQQVLSNNASRAYGRANELDRAAGEATASFTTQLGTALNSYFGGKKA